MNGIRSEDKSYRMAFRDAMSKTCPRPSFPGRRTSSGEHRYSSAVGRSPGWGPGGAGIIWKFGNDWQSVNFSRVAVVYLWLRFVYYRPVKFEQKIRLISKDFLEPGSHRVGT